MDRARVVRLGMAVLVLAGLGAAAVLLVLPLPDVRTAGLGGPQTVVCGRGSSGTSALSMLLNPGQVAAGPNPPTVAQEEQLEVTEQLCLGEAQGRLLEAMGVALPLAVGALVVWAISEAPRRRASTAFGGPHPAGWYPDPWSAGSFRWWDGARWGPPHPRGTAGYGPP